MFSSSSYSSYSRRRQKVPMPVLIGAIPVGLLVLELLLRLGVSLAGKADEMNAYQGEPPIATAYRFKPFTRENQPVKGIPGFGALAVQTHPLTGYQLMPSQTNSALQINSQGFRANEDVPVKKPSNEVRILVVGDSSAFGSLASQNQATFAQQLETRLNEQVKTQQANPGQFRPEVLPYFADEMQKALQLPPKIRIARYRVINAAVPGFLSSNTLADFTTRLQPYQPDMVVLMNGYSDLLSDQVAANLATDKLAARPVRHLFGSMREGFQGFFNHLYLTKTLRYWVLKPQPELAELVNPLSDGTALEQQLKADDAVKQARLDRYQAHLQQLANITGSSKIPLIVALTPELHQRDAAKQTEAEKTRLDALGDAYQQQIQADYKRLNQAVIDVKSTRSNLIPVPLNKALNEVEGEAFRDTIHLTDAAQTAISDRLYQTIAPMLQVQSKPFGSK